MSLLTHLECTSCSKVYDSKLLQTLCECGKVLFARYDLEKAKETINKNMEGRANNLWRIHEIMPCGPKYRFTLGEGNTPIISFEDEDKFLFELKNEGFNPTGTFKSRGSIDRSIPNYGLIKQFLVRVKILPLRGLSL